MVAAEETSPFTVEVEPRVTRSLKKRGLSLASFPGMEDHLAQSPLRGPKIRHLKANLRCFRRWRCGDYRLLYTVYEEQRTVVIFDAGIRNESTYR